MKLKQSKIKRSEDNQIELKSLTCDWLDIK